MALLGGVALDALLAVAHKLAKVAVLGIVAALVLLGLDETRALHRAPYYMLEWGRDEPRDLIPEFGQVIARTFPADAEILCNFPWYTPQLEYYGRRQIVFKLTTYTDWKPLLAGATPVGGVIWLGEPSADELLANLPKGTSQIIHLGDRRFCLWKPGG